MHMWEIKYSVRTATGIKTRQHVVIVVSPSAEEAKELVRASDPGDFIEVLWCDALPTDTVYLVQ